MRLSLIVGLCIVLCSAVVVQAELVNVTNGVNTYTGVLSYTRGTVTTSTDMITIYCNDLAAMSGQTSLQVFEGTFQPFVYQGAPGSANLKLTQAVTTYPTYSWYQFADTTGASTNALVTKGFRGSFVNMPRTDSTGVVWGETLTGSPYTYNWIDIDEVPQSLTGQTSTKLYGSWNTGSGRHNGDVLATIYVDKNAGLNFAGSWGNGTNPNGGWGFSSSVNMGGSFNIPAIGVPEPATLMLAFGGLVGLLCYAWRKRR